MYVTVAPIKALCSERFEDWHVHVYVCMLQWHLSRLCVVRGTGMYMYMCVCYSGTYQGSV